MKNHGARPNVKHSNSEAVKGIYHALEGIECEICGDTIGAKAVNLEGATILSITTYCPKCNEIFVLKTEGKSCRSC